MAKYRKRPIVIEAMQFTEDTKNQVFNFVTCNHCAAWDSNGNPALSIRTLEGDVNEPTAKARGLYPWRYCLVGQHPGCMAGLRRPGD